MTSEFGHYRILGELPARGTCRVSEAEDDALQRKVVIKSLPEAQCSDAAAREAFLQAGRAMAGISHRHVVTVFEIVDAPTGPYLVVESVTGGTLRDWLNYFPPSLTDSLRIGREIAEALAAADELRLTPVDLSLDNVWMERLITTESAEPKPSNVKLRDFQLSAHEEAARDRLAAQKALGSVLHRLLTGRDPTADEPLCVVAPRVPVEVARFVDELRQLDRDSDRSWPAVAERFEELEQQSQQRSWLTAPVVAVAALVLLLGAAIAVPLLRGGVERPSEAKPESPLIATTQTITEKPESPEIKPIVEPSATAPSTAPPVPSQVELEPLSQAWLDFVATLPAKSQVNAVIVELQRRNPKFDREHHDLWIKEDRVAGILIHTDEIVDLSPIRAWPNLIDLACPGRSSGSGRLEDLAPLEGSQLVKLRCGWTRVKDLRPLAQLPLKQLRIGGTRVDDLSPLADLPLEDLEIWHTRIRDLNPLRKMASLRRLSMHHVLVTDISPLADLPLTELQCEGVLAKDWTPLSKLPLEKLTIDYDPARHAELLRGIATLKEINGRPAAETLK